MEKTEYLIARGIKRNLQTLGVTVERSGNRDDAIKNRIKYGKHATYQLNGVYKARPYPKSEYIRLLYTVIRHMGLKCGK